MSESSGGKDFLSKLAERGEEAIERMGDLPGAGRVMDAMTSMRDRVDELQKRVRGLDALERRVESLERRVDALAPKPGLPEPMAVGGTGSETTEEPPASTS